MTLLPDKSAFLCIIEEYLIGKKQLNGNLVMLKIYLDGLDLYCRAWGMLIFQLLFLCCEIISWNRWLSRSWYEFFKILCQTTIRTLMVGTYWKYVISFIIIETFQNNLLGLQKFIEGKNWNSRPKSWGGFQREYTLNGLHYDFNMAFK